MNKELDEADRLNPSTRTYAAKEAVRLARERVRRNDMIVTQLMQRSALKGFESGPTEEIVHDGPGELARPLDHNDNGHIEIDSEEQVVETENYRIKTSSTIVSFFRDLFD
jgi:hypothetical protein